MKKLFYLASWESFIVFFSTAKPLSVATLTCLQLVLFCLHCGCKDIILSPQLKVFCAGGSKRSLNHTEQMD